MTPELLWSLGRVGGATVSSDGTKVVYAVRHYELAENGGASTIYVLDVDSGATRPLVREWKSAGALQYAQTPFGERVYFTGRSGASGESTQVWALNPVDGALIQVTDLEDAPGNLKVSPDREADRLHVEREARRHGERGSTRTSPRRTRASSTH